MTAVVGVGVGAGSCGVRGVGVCGGCGGLWEGGKLNCRHNPVLAKLPRQRPTAAGSGWQLQATLVHNTV